MIDPIIADPPADAFRSAFAPAFSPVFVPERVLPPPKSMPVWFLHLLPGAAHVPAAVHHPVLALAVAVLALLRFKPMTRRPGTPWPPYTP